MKTVYQNIFSLAETLICNCFRLKRKKILGYLFKKIWFRVCSVTAKILAKIEGKEAKFFLQIYQGKIRI